MRIGSQPSEITEVSASTALNHSNGQPTSIGSVTAVNGDAFDSDRPPIVREGGDFKTRFELHEELGKGRFGVVYRCVERETGTLLAAKIVKCIKSTDKTKVRGLK